MKKTILSLFFLTVLLQPLAAQDTLWQKPAPKGNYYYNNWIDTTQEYSANSIRLVFASIMASQFVAKDEVLEVYGIAAMLTDFYSLAFIPSSTYPTLESYLAWKFPEDPTLDNCEEWLMLFQYNNSSSPVMQQVGDSLHVHRINTPVSYYITSDTPPVSYYDAWLKPVYERYFSSPQTVHDTFYVGFTHTSGGFSEVDEAWHEVRAGLDCLCFKYVGQTLDYDDEVAAYWQPSMSDPQEWVFLHRNMHCSYFLFPILTPPDTTSPFDPIIPNPGDTLTTGYLILHSGNTLVVAPGDTLVIGGDTLVVTSDTLVVTLGDTLVLGGSTFVVNPGDTLFVNPGDTLFVSPDGSVTAGPGGTFVVGSGSGTPGDNPGDDPGVGLRQADMLYRYTAVSPNPATQRATVTSSFGLERIEVYDPQGRQMLTLPATGYRATLDLSAWPRGTYLLRITTPLGPTTKKLIVR